MTRFAPPEPVRRRSLQRCAFTRRTRVSSRAGPGSARTLGVGTHISGSETHGADRLLAAALWPGLGLLLPSLLILFLRLLLLALFLVFLAALVSHGLSFRSLWPRRAAPARA